MKIKLSLNELKDLISSKIKGNSKIHQMKSLDVEFNEIAKRNKLFKITGDKDYEIGDYIIMNEWSVEGNKATGRSLLVKITYKTDYSQLYQNVVLGLELIDTLKLEIK